VKLIKYIAKSCIKMLNGKQRIRGMYIWNASYLVVEFSVGAMKNESYWSLALLQTVDQTKRTNLILNAILVIFL
jgi:hypothetical protein